METWLWSQVPYPVLVKGVLLRGNQWVVWLPWGGFVGKVTEGRWVEAVL